MLDSGFPIGKDGFPFKDVLGNGGGSGPALLTAGSYWMDTLVPPAPRQGLGWTVGPPPAAISGSANMSVLTVKATPLVPVDFAINATYKGVLSDAFFYWNGLIYVTQGGLAIPWTFHAAYSTELGNFTPSLPPSASIWLWIATESDTTGGNLRNDNFGVT